MPISASYSAVPWPTYISLNLITSFGIKKHGDAIGGVHINSEKKGIKQLQNKWWPFLHQDPRNIFKHLVKPPGCKRMAVSVKALHSQGCRSKVIVWSTTFCALFGIRASFMKCFLWHSLCSCRCRWYSYISILVTTMRDVCKQTTKDIGKHWATRLQYPYSIYKLLKLSKCVRIIIMVFAMD
jgi:hypothetical protein